jgi:inorganic phosphate transporter, PiT family
VDALGVVIVITMAMVFNYTNGFHDAANAIATSVSTRALTPRVALAMAAVMNLLGSFLGGGVAKTVGKDIVTLPPGTESLIVVFSALSGAIAWNLFTWWFGLPSSSSYALFGGLIGATLVYDAQNVEWGGVWHKVILPMVASPLAGFVIAYVFMLGILWAFRRAHPGRVSRGFRLSQTVSAAGMAFGHGLQDAAKIMGIVVLALVVGGYQDTFEIPFWVYFLTAAVMSAGTYAGGWRIMRTLGRKIIHVTPPQGFAAETTAASILYVAGVAFKLPVSTTFTITGSIMGVGATKRMSAVRWGVAGNIVTAWILTFPGAALVAALVFVVVNPILGS